MGVNSLPKTVTQQRRDCDLNPGPSTPESSTLTTTLGYRATLIHDTTDTTQQGRARHCSVMTPYRTCYERCDVF